MDWVPEVEVTKPTVAEGVAISKPARGKRLLQVLRETDGKVLAIGENKIIEAQKMLAGQGFYVEPTSALAVAGLNELSSVIKDTETVVIPLTGNGLKGEPKQD
jgi:threonine synthase